METLLDSCKIVYTTTFDENMACDFLKQCNPELQCNDEEVKRAVKIAGYIPGFMSKNVKTLEDVQKYVRKKVLWEWKTIFPFLAKDDSWAKKQHIQLLIALIHHLPLAAVDLEIDDAEDLLPVQCFLVYIDKESIPRFYVDLPTETVSSIIQSIRSFITGVKSDEPSVLGYCFEGAVSVIFQEITLNLKIAFQNPNDTANRPSDIENFKLNHEIWPTRYEKERLQNIPVGYLCHTQKHTPGIDYFSLVKHNKLGNCLLLIQTSIIQQGHQRKIKTFVLTNKHFFSLQIDGKNLDSVIYLYLNPNYDDNTLEGTDYLKNVLDDRHTIKYLKDYSWYFAQPTGDSQLAIIGKYFETKHLIGFGYA